MHGSAGLAAPGRHFHEEVCPGAHRLRRSLELGLPSQPSQVRGKSTRRSHADVGEDSTFSPEGPAGDEGSVVGARVASSDESPEVRLSKHRVDLAEALPHITCSWSSA